MKKYNVTFYYHTNITVAVKAEDEDEALDIAYSEVEDSKYDKVALRNMQEDSGPDVEEV